MPVDEVMCNDATSLNAGRLWPELGPLPFGDHLGGAVDDLDGRLFVDGVRRDADVGGPPLRVGQRVGWESIQVREDREVDDSQGAVVRRRRPLNEGRRRSGASSPCFRTHSHPHHVGQRRQQIGQPGLAHPVAQVGRVAAVDQEHVGLPDPGDPSLRADGGQRGSGRGHRATPSPGRRSAATWARRLRGRAPMPVRTSGGPTGRLGRPGRGIRRSACREAARAPSGCSGS